MFLPHFLMLCVTVREVQQDKKWNSKNNIFLTMTYVV